VSTNTTNVPDTPRVDKTAVLNGLHSYLGSRIDSIGRRASFMMALLGSFLGIAAGAIMHQQAATFGDKLAYFMRHPSIVVGIVAMALLLMGETAKIKNSSDLYSRIAFSDEPVADLHQTFVGTPINDLFAEMMQNIRIVGGFLKKKVWFYNCGSILFVIGVTMFVCGF